MMQPMCGILLYGNIYNIWAANVHLLIMVFLHGITRTMNFVESSSLMLMIFCGLEMMNLNATL